MPLLFKYTEPLLGVWKIEETSDELLSMLELSSEYLPFLQQLKTEKRRQEWLATRVLLKELLGKELLIAYNEEGAPYLPDSTLDISISHTTGYAAVLVQKQSAVGIDIEYISQRVLKIRNRFLSPEESLAIDKEHETEHLLIHWCAKEALFKMIHQKEVDFIHHLHIKPFPFSNQGDFIAFETKTPEANSYRLSYQVLPEYVLVYSV